MINQENKHYFIYNFFPLLYGDMKKWKSKLNNIADMGFNIIYLNPIYQSGFSGSLYAVKEYFKIDGRFGKEETPEKNIEVLKDFLKAAHNLKLKVILDLVINHTSIDCPLVKEKPEWYMLKDNNVVHPGAFEGNHWIEWGDLARINNENSPDEKNLYKYWLKVCNFYLGLGFDGFRADAAYQVPSKLWEYLIKNIKNNYPEVLFVGETLGCEIDDTIEIANLGFDAVMNSSKYWDYEDIWIFRELYQQLIYLNSFPTISFPESHDTRRLINEVNGNVMVLLAKLQFVAFWSSGFMIPTGFEYGFKKQINVVVSNENDFESTSINFSSFIKQVLTLKRKYKVLSEDTYIEKIEIKETPNILYLLKISKNREERVLFILNKNLHGDERVHFKKLSDVLRVNGKPIDISVDLPMDYIPQEFDYILKPSQVRMIYVSGKGGILKKKQEK